MNIIIREYDFDTDPPKIVKHLFTQFQGEKGVLQLRHSDEYFLEDPDNRKRFVVEIDKELHSTCVLIKGELSSNSDKFYLFSIVTSTIFRGKGISEKIVNFALTQAKMNGGRIVILSTQKDNIKARKFYEKIGFIQYGCLPLGTLNFKGTSYTDEIYYYFNLNDI